MNSITELKQAYKATLGEAGMITGQRVEVNLAGFNRPNFAVTGRVVHWGFEGGEGVAVVETDTGAFLTVSVQRMRRAEEVAA